MSVTDCGAQSVQKTRLMALTNLKPVPLVGSM